MLAVRLPKYAWVNLDKARREAAKKYGRAISRDEYLSTVLRYPVKNVFV